MSVRILVMGVSGCGKTTVGSELSKYFGVPLLEGDEFHPESNILKMSAGIPLNDRDRQPWLEALAQEMTRLHDKGYIVASSALKKNYRKTLEAGGKNSFHIVFLDGNKQMIYSRMQRRSDHFMPASLLDSQFLALEVPDNAINVDISMTLEDQINRIILEIENDIELKDKSINMASKAGDIGVIGLGVMGKALARNFAGKGMKVAIYNAPLPGEESIMSSFDMQYKDLDFIPCPSLADVVGSLRSPRKILLMVKAGKPVDMVIEQLLPLMEKDDILIDAGNSFYKDTVRRQGRCMIKGVTYVGMGVSGGEEGALKGPSMMPAGELEAKSPLIPMLEKVAAKADGRPCVGWIGTGGAGHFVKMIHNGIEYADMQILSEVYGFCRHGFGISNHGIADLLETWKDSPHNSYLLDITIDILRKEVNGQPVIDTILDVAGHKGTGLWTSQESLDLGASAPTILSAMLQRILSSEKVLREKLKSNSHPTVPAPDHKMIKDGVLFCRLIALVEGFHIIIKASGKNSWEISLPEITAVWRGGCIIRSDMLLIVRKAIEAKSGITHLFESDYLMTELESLYDAACNMVAQLSLLSVATPGISAALNYYKSMTTKYLPVNMIQAQRDYFGAHTYRTLNDRNAPVHTQWK